MLGIDLAYIELSGVKLPIRCDMLVLEKIQEDYGDISEFENKLIGFEPIYNEDGSAKTNENGKSIGKIIILLKHILIRVRKSIIT